MTDSNSPPWVRISKKISKDISVKEILSTASADYEVVA